MFSTKLSPFNLENSTEYSRWRASKLNRYKEIDENTPPYFYLVFQQGKYPTPTELNKVLEYCKKDSLCLYRIKDHAEYSASKSKKIILHLAKELGLTRLDSNICADEDNLTSITQTSHAGQHDYIPYSNKRLSWHTDGYYNTPDKKINSMLLHCAQPAQEGGESLFMDHEIAYLLLRDENPEYVKALMQVDALTIPANILDGKVIRDAQSGPVFSINSQGQLHMRYSARKRNIEWKQNTPTLEAVAFLEELMQSSSKYIINHSLKAGEGIICRNVLHCRTAFVDSDNSEEKRLLFRGRYYDELPLA